MALGYIYDLDDQLIVYTFLKELGYGKRPGGNWWAMRALVAMADNEERVKDIITRWTFPAAMQPAINRIIASRGRSLSLFGHPRPCHKVLQRAIAEGWQDDYYSNANMR